MWSCKKAPVFVKMVGCCCETSPCLSIFLTFLVIIARLAMYSSSVSFPIEPNSQPFKISKKVGVAVKWID